MSFAEALNSTCLLSILPDAEYPPMSANNGDAVTINDSNMTRRMDLTRYRRQNDVFKDAILASNPIAMFPSGFHHWELPPKC